MFFFNEGNVLSWATFFPLAGAGIIVLLLALKFFAKLSKRTMDDAARWIALVASGGSLLAAVAAWIMFDGAKPGVHLHQHVC